MTPLPPSSPREELEARITALLFGELPAEDASALRQAIAQDAELSRLHDRLKQAIGLVRETAASPAQEDLASPKAPTLSPDRRAALFAAFKVIRPKELRKAQATFIQREWLAVAAMIVILCLAGAIVSKNFVRARFASQKQYLYVARDERWAETATPTTPLARGDNGRVSVSGKPVNSPAIAGREFFAEGQPQNDVTPTTILPTDGKAPEKTAADLSVNAAIDLAPSASISRLEPEMKSFSAVADALKQSSPAHLPLLSPLPPPLEPSQSGERAARQFATIALPTVDADAQATGSEDKKLGWEGRSLDAAKATSFEGDASGPRRSPDGGAGRGGGGAGGRPAEYAGVPLGGSVLNYSADGSAVNRGGLGGVPNSVLAPGSMPPMEQAWAAPTTGRPTTPAPGAKPVDGAASFGYGVAPVPAPAGPATDLDLMGRRPSLAAAQDDRVQIKEMDFNRNGVTTNAVIASFPAFTGVPDSATYNNSQFGGFGGAGQLANALQLSEGFFAPTPKTDALGVLGDKNGTTSLQVNGATEATPRGTSPGGVYSANSVGYVSMATATGLGSVKSGEPAEAESKKLNEVSKSERLDPATGTTTFQFDAEGKDTLRDLQRESGLKSDEKAQVAQQAADGGVALNKRLKIALPETERAEAEEKLRIASGPVVISEIYYNPATGLPAQKEEDVALAVEEGNRRQIPSRAVRTPASQLATVDKPGITDLELQQGFVSPTLEPETLRKLEAFRLEAATELARLEKTWQQVTNSFEADPKRNIAAVTQDSLLQKLVEELSLNESKLAEVTNSLAPGHPEVRGVRDKIALLNDQIDVRLEGIKAGLKVRLDVGRETLGALSRKLDEPPPKLAVGAPTPQPEVATTDNAFSTFSLNVSDVSFKLAAASLEKGQMPDPATVRSEEFINAFDYRDPEPKGSAPIAFAWERARYPFAHDRDLVRFSVKTAASGRQPGRPLNLVLLLDNSGSMERADRIRIRQECLRVLASQLQPQDRVSVVAFARTARLWVDGLPGNHAGELSQRVGTLAPEGGTNLEDAMNVAYKTALRHFLANGVNRVVLLTDGAANLGDVEPESLKKKVETHRKQGVALDCFGIGWDGLNDELLEALSRNGDGRYGFVNTPEAASSEFAGQLAGALKVAASDVKVQVEWNPRRVTAYRQIGYAKHQLKKEQFRDNTVDAAEIGAAEAGNALYTVQVNPRGEGPVATVRVRFKVPGTGDYREHEWTVPYEGGAKSLDASSPALRLAASASAFSEWLVSSPFAVEVTPDNLLAQLSGVPETWPADPRPKKLEWMIRQAKSVAGK